MTNCSVAMSHLSITRPPITSPMSYDIFLSLIPPLRPSRLSQTLWNTLNMVNMYPPLMADQWACFKGFASPLGLIPLILSHGWLYIVAPSAGNTLDFSLWFSLASITQFCADHKVALTATATTTDQDWGQLDQKSGPVQLPVPRAGLSNTMDFLSYQNNFDCIIYDLSYKI
jgi:hypothetical protein